MNRRTSDDAGAPGPVAAPAGHEDLPFEHVGCYLCGRTDGRILVDDPPFTVKLCGCGLGYTTPRVRGDRLKEIYDRGYFTSESAKDFGYTGYAADAPGYLRTFAMKVALVQRFVPSGRILEVGCAAGFFLKAARDAGFEAHGIEVVASILAHARDTLKLDNLFLGTVEQYESPPARFDAIAMWDVIEHVADPIATLSRMRPWLKDSGRLFIQTQDLASVTRRLMRSKWTHFKQLEHIHHFSPATIRVVLDRANFDVEHVRKRGAGKYVSVAFVIERMRRFGRLPHLAARAFAPLGRKFLYVNPWDEIIVVARPR